MHHFNFKLVKLEHYNLFCSQIGLISGVNDEETNCLDF